MRPANCFGSMLAPLLGIALLVRVVSLPAFAALGEDVASVESDGARLKAQQTHVTSGAGYTIHEMQLSSGTTVREYVSPAGKVFAVSWQGPSVPDLRQTLGTYFDQYVASAKTTPRASHHHLSVRQPDLVVNTSGHMRAYYGQAYVPSLLPQNFSLDDIK